MRGLTRSLRDAKNVTYSSGHEACALLVADRTLDTILCDLAAATDPIDLAARRDTGYTGPAPRTPRRSLRRNPGATQGGLPGSLGVPHERLRSLKSVTAVRMPTGSGDVVHAFVAASPPDLLPRLALMTGGATSEESRRFIAAAGLPLLEKPFQVRELADFVARPVRGAAKRGAVPITSAR